MDIIRDSAEHHLLTTLDALKNNAQDWLVLHFSLSKTMSHSALVKTPDLISTKIEDSAAHSHALLEKIQHKTTNINHGYLYLFADNDILLLTKVVAPEEKAIVDALYKNMKAELRENCSDVGILSQQIYLLEKLADKKLISAGRFEAYKIMTDKNKTTSIDARRSRRDDPVVLVVEDDRFTAAYTSNILNSEYNVIICRNGEEAIKAYIENAPDMVYMDIHLPGLNGHETVEAIKAIDPKAYIVMLSVDTSADSVKKSVSGGAEKFLKKPFSKDRLLSMTKTSPYIHMRNLQSNSSIRGTV